jgi:hypothetical protein
MKAILNRWCTLGAALVIGAAGIFELIDQATMITLIVVLVCLPRTRGACGAVRTI